MIISLMAGLLIGYGVGVMAGLSWSFDKAMILLDKQGIKINFDENMLRVGLTQYKENIGGCLFVDSINKTNASLYLN